MKKYDYLRIINDGIEWLLLWTLSGVIYIMPALIVSVAMMFISYKMTGENLSLWFRIPVMLMIGAFSPHPLTPTKIKAKYKEVVEKIKIYFEKYKI